MMTIKLPIHFIAGCYDYDGRWCEGFFADAKDNPVSEKDIAAALNAYDKINLERPEVIESLAEQAHIEWSLWTRWMIDQWSPERVKGWERQIATRYTDLSETEKEADRREARAYIAAIVAAVPDVFPPKDGAP